MSLDATTDILPFVAEAIAGDAASTVTLSDITVALKTCLFDLARQDLLVNTGTGSVTTGDTSISFPTACRWPLSIQLTNAGGVASEPLDMLPEGQKGYRANMHLYPNAGEPTNFSIFDGKIWLFPKADAAYTYSIEFLKDHADSTTIEFPDRFKQAIQIGTTYWKWALKGNTQNKDHWAPLYAREVDLMRQERDS